MRTMPMIAMARNDSSIFGVRMNHSSLEGLRRRTWMASFGHDLMQLAQRLQLALESMVRGNENRGQPGTVSVPLKQAARLLHVAQTLESARSSTMPARA